MIEIAVVAGVVAVGAGLLLWRRRPTRGGLHVTGNLHVNVNCSDFERSRAFYERLGFRVLMEVPSEGAGTVAAAVGMAAYRVRGALLVHRDGFTLDLLEWQQPRDPTPPAEGLNRLGIARIAFATTDLDADVASLRAAGVRLLSEDPGSVPDGLGGTTRFVCFQDPDGTVLELVELGPLMASARGASRLFR